MTVQAVQIFTTNNFKANSTNYDAKSNVMSKMDNSKSVADAFTKSNQVAFKGNLAKAGENLLGDAGSKIGGKVKRLGEEATEAIGGAFRKLTGKKELPETEKPILNPALQTMEEFFADALNGNKTAQKNIKVLTEYGLEIPKGGVPADGGYIKTYHKDDIFAQIDTKVANGEMSKWEATKAKDDLSFGSSDVDTSGLDASGHSFGDDVSGGYDGSGVDTSDVDFSGGGDDGGLLDVLGDILGAS